MTLKQLLEILEDMTEDQLKLDFVVMHDGEYIWPMMVTEVKADHDEGEGKMNVGQPIFM